MKINSAQRNVLRWVGDGCPDGVMVGYSYRVSAAALQSRGLVRIRGRGPTWRAELTAKGQETLADLRKSLVEAAPPKSPSGPVEQLKTEQLVADLIAAGGKLVLPDQTAEGGVNWRQRAYAAQRHGRVPAGKHLSVARTEAGFEIELREGATGNELGSEEISVPRQLRNYHPAVRAFRDSTHTHYVSRRTLSRACRVMHALAIAIGEQGHKISSDEVANDDARGYGPKPRVSGSFTVEINGHRLRLAISEKGVRSRGAWEAEHERREQNRREMRFYAWEPGRVEPYDKGATGLLELSILEHSPRQTRWGDRQRWRLDDRLPQVIRELEAMAEEAEQRRLARERQERERRVAWETAMDNARQQALHHHRVGILGSRVDAWREGEAIREYCAAVEERHADELATNSSARKWLQFARDRADRLQGLPQMPDDPELTHEDLKRFLGGWSPYGPERGRW